MFRLLFVLTAIAVYIPDAAAQTAGSSQSPQAGDLVTVVAGRYHQPAGPYAALYNGAEHIDYDPRMIGSAYFGDNDWKKGSVYYNNVLFTNVSLKFDLVRSKLVVLHHNQFYKLELVDAFLDSFSVDGQSFIKLRDKEVPSPPAPGFYHRLVQGPVTVLVRREKIVREFIDGMELKREINEKYSYYLLKEGTYYAIDKQRDLLSLMGDDKKEVQQQWRAAGIKFRRQKEAAIVRAAQYYNQLNPR